MVKSLLTHTQLQRLKEHKYSGQGTSISEQFMQPYWKWLVSNVPLWVAPNLLTFIGLLINLLTTLPVILMDMNAEGKVWFYSIDRVSPCLEWSLDIPTHHSLQSPAWSYSLCALGFFIYQSLDAIDGKQARRTFTSSPLGELFDHGCDAVSIILVTTSAICAIGMQRYPYVMLTFVLLMLVLAFTYHWQTYVCGVLHFKLWVCKSADDMYLEPLSLCIISL